MIRTCKSGRSTHECWVHVSQRSVSWKVSKLYNRRIFGNGLAHVPFEVSWRRWIRSDDLSNDHLTDWFKVLFLFTQRVLIISVNLQVWLTYKSKCKNFGRYHQKCRRPRSLWIRPNLQKSSQRYLRDELLLRRTWLKSHTTVRHWCVCFLVDVILILHSGVRVHRSRHRDQKSISLWRIQTERYDEIWEHIASQE